MRAIDILNKRFSVLVNVEGYTYHQGLSDYTQANLTLRQIIDLSSKYKQPIDVLRSIEYHSKEQKEYKKMFPCWFVGGLFPIEKTEDEDILVYSNLVAIDIDGKDNPDIDLVKLKDKLFKLPYVVLVSKSISGKGIYALVLVEDGRYTKEYYAYIAKLWSKQYNVIIDEHCKNIGRKRFISYDDEMLLKKDDEEVVEWKLRYKEVIKEEEIKPIVNCSKYNYTNDNGLTQKAIWYLLNDGYSIDDFKCEDRNEYSTWYHVGCDFRHFDDGLQMFEKFSTNSSKYNDTISEIHKKWNNTKIEKTSEEVSRKWCGICKRIYGKDWIKKIQQNRLL